MQFIGTRFLVKINSVELLQRLKFSTRLAFGDDE